MSLLRQFVARSVSVSASVSAPLSQTRTMAIAYKPPVRDINFVIDEVLDGDKHFETHGFEECTQDLRHSITDECAKFASEVLSPISATGDKEGCVLDPKTTDVKTPTGWKEAYADFASAGWCGLSVPEEYGGQGLPQSLGMIKSELISTSNWAWGMYPGLSVGCMNTLLMCASEEQKKKYLPKLCEGTWSGTMCLTEPHCGTDLGRVATKAIPQKDGTYKITGTKIFISCGEHDMTENIVHIVLARAEGGKPGTKGLSLFIVPKYLGEDGSLESKKNIVCGGLENKMGIHGSSTCIMNFEDSTGYLIGNEGDGMEQMFVFMNTARIGTAIQGLAAAELGLQGSLPYARERMSMRALSGKKNPTEVGDYIINHGDVRRMLLTMKAFAEGARCMIYDAALQGDEMLSATTPQQRKEFEENLGFVTPILKGFLTEVGFESANLGMQVLGGHGFISEHGLEQNVRDSRISTLYEGTTGIQALDLLGRKVFQQKGKSMLPFTKSIFSYCKDQLWNKRETSKHKKEALKVSWYTMKWFFATSVIGFQVLGQKNRDVVSTSSVNFMMYSGYTTMAYYWLRMMDTASAKLASHDVSESDKAFYKSKLQTGKFYFDYLLPRADSYLSVLSKSPNSIMGKDAFEGIGY
eukprot:m.57080 g.57080  ORF g.57080 m.57080 type:complete len:638 (+) comp11213_c0_seq1:109-2022(+)